MHKVIAARFGALQSWWQCIVAVIMVHAIAALTATAAIPSESLELGEIPLPDRQAEIAAHFKAREPLDFNPIIHGDAFVKSEWWTIAKRDEPDRVMNHQFAVLGTYLQFPADIDWNGMINGDRETMYVLNRFGFLVVLREAYEKTGDTKYLRKGVMLMLDWARKCPVGGRQLWAAWRPAEIGYRLHAWCQFIDCATRQNTILPHELCHLLRSVQEQAQFLSTSVAPQQGCDGIVAATGLGITSLIFPELRGSAGWLATAWRTLLADLQSQIYPDGSHEEMSPYYESIVVLSVARVSDLARQRNISVPQMVLDRLVMMARYLALIRKPKGTLPACNDGDSLNIDPLIEKIARWQKQDDLIWLTTNGQEGRKPASPNFFAAYSGLVIFRTDWTSQTQSLLLDTGPYGTARQHSDALQVEYSALEQDFLVDPGRYTYEETPVRNWLTGTSAHCTIIVDGGPQRTMQYPESLRANQPIDVALKSTPEFGYARTLYRYGYEAPGAQAIMHRRSVFFVPDQYAVVYDLLQGQGAHRIHLHWSFVPMKVRQIDNQTVVASGSKASLLLATIGPPNIRTNITTGLKDPPIGWFSPVYNALDPAPHVTMTVRATLPARFVTLLLPFRNEADKPPDASLQIETMRDELVRVTVNGKSNVLSPSGITTQPE